MKNKQKVKQNPNGKEEEKKKGGNSLGCGGRGLMRGGVWVADRAYA